MCTFVALLNTVVNAQKRPDHVLVLLLENHSYLEIKDSTKAPYINSLLVDPLAAAFTQSFALTHPSQPNYIMLFSTNSIHCFKLLLHNFCAMKSLRLFTEFKAVIGRKFFILPYAGFFSAN